MFENQNQKYQCGCGKSYTSYPAYSTHKKLKHHNQSITGTQLPKQYIPKRGRPSFTLPTANTPNHHNYAALTIVEVALLKLEEENAGILA